ncbi:Tigger transposable element-derived protein 4 [Anthophora retusa]
MPRKDLSLAEKIAILDKIKGHLPHTSHRRLSEITGVPKSTIARLISIQDKLREEWACNRKQGTFQKRNRQGKDPDVENALNQWFSIVKERGICVSGSMLKNKAEDLAKKLGHYDFKATDGWLSRWKCRNNIKLKKEHGEENSVDIVNAVEWQSYRLPVLLQAFRADDIYNVDETGLFYRATPDGSLCYDHVTLSDSKKAMDRVTILCCVNISGTNKKKLLVIGKSAMPRCFRGLSTNSLPVEYHANRNAWMTSDIFKQWLIRWDVELQRESRKILLILDNCAAHPKCSECLKNIQLEFLDSNTSSMQQPLGMGIIKNLKVLYREKLINHILQAIEDNLLTSSSTAKEVSAKVNILQAIQFVADSWREISTKTIQNCFYRCGFKHPNLEISEIKENDHNAILQLQQVTNYEDFESIDSAIECYNTNEDCKDDISEIIESKYQNEELECEESNEDKIFEPEQVTLQDAGKFINGLRRFFMQEGNEGSPLSSLDICADFVRTQSIKNIRQSTLGKFIVND